MKVINFDGANVSECLKYDLLTVCEFIFGGPTGSPNGGLRSQVSGLRSQASGLRSQVSGLRSQVSDLRSQVTCLRSQVPGLGSRVVGLGSQVRGCLWGVLGTLWVSLDGFKGSTGGLWGMGPPIQKFPDFLQRHRPSPRNLSDMIYKFYFSLLLDD